MWAAFIVATLYGKATGRTWLSSLGTATVIGWTANQVRRGAFLRIASAGNTLMSMTLWQVAAGVGLGVAGGIGVSQALFGEEGRKDAIAFYTGEASVQETLRKTPGRIAAIIQGNRAVENNAAGLSTGTNIVTLGVQQQRAEFAAPDPTHPSADWWGDRSLY